MSDLFDVLDGLFPPDQAAMPDPTFVDNLRDRIDRIEGRANRTTERSTMERNTFIPYLTVNDGRAAIEFYREVFGAEVLEEELFEMDDGRLGHASLHIGDDYFYLADEFPEMNIVSPPTLGGSTMAIVVEVADADETYAHAVAAGATAERPVANQHGARSGWFRDPWGHRWSPTSPALE